jgi:hypothetical protein
MLAATAPRHSGGSRGHGQGTGAPELTEDGPRPNAPVAASQPGGLPAHAPPAGRAGGWPGRGGDATGAGQGDAGVHGTGAGPRRGEPGRQGQRRLRAGRYPVRDPDGSAPVHPGEGGARGRRDRGVRAARRLRRRRGACRAGEGVPSARTGGASSRAWVSLRAAALPVDTSRSRSARSSDSNATRYLSIAAPSSLILGHIHQVTGPPAPATPCFLDPPGPGAHCQANTSGKARGRRRQ